MFIDYLLQHVLGETALITALFSYYVIFSDLQTLLYVCMFLRTQCVYLDTHTYYSIFSTIKPSFLLYIYMHVYENTAFQKCPSAIFNT